MSNTRYTEISPYSLSSLSCVVYTSMKQKEIKLKKSEYGRSLLVGDPDRLCRNIIWGHNQSFLEGWNVELKEINNINIYLSFYMK